MDHFTLKGGGGGRVIMKNNIPQVYFYYHTRGFLSRAAADVIRDLTQNTTATATRTSLNKGLN